jgi:hypothetical protein
MYSSVHLWLDLTATSYKRLWYNRLVDNKIEMPFQDSPTIIFHVDPTDIIPKYCSYLFTGPNSQIPMVYMHEYDRVSSLWLIREQTIAKITGIAEY